MVVGNTGDTTKGGLDTEVEESSKQSGTVSGTKQSFGENVKLSLNKDLPNSQNVSLQGLAKLRGLEEFQSSFKELSRIESIQQLNVNFETDKDDENNREWTAQKPLRPRNNDSIPSTGQNSP